MLVPNQLPFCTVPWPDSETDITPRFERGIPGSNPGWANFFEQSHSAMEALESTILAIGLARNRGEKKTDS